MEYISTSHGIFHDCIVHDFDMMRFITGRNPVEIFAVGSSFVEGIGKLNDLDNVLVTLKYDDGMIASIDVNRKRCIRVRSTNRSVRQRGDVAGRKPGAGFHRVVEQGWVAPAYD